MWGKVSVFFETGSFSLREVICIYYTFLLLHVVLVFRYTAFNFLPFSTHNDAKGKIDVRLSGFLTVINRKPANARPLWREIRVEKSITDTVHMATMYRIDCSVPICNRSNGELKR